MKSERIDNIGNVILEIYLMHLNDIDQDFKASYRQSLLCKTDEGQNVLLHLMSF